MEYEILNEHSLSLLSLGSNIFTEHLVLELVWSHVKLSCVVLLLILFNVEIIVDGF